MEAKTAQKKKASPIKRDGFKIKQNNHGVNSNMFYLDIQANSITRK